MSESHDVPPDATSPAPLETSARQAQRSRMGLNLFWRTFFLLALLLVGCILAWLQTLRALELEPAYGNADGARKWLREHPE